MEPKFVVRVRDREGTLIRQQDFKNEQQAWGFVESKRIKGNVVQFFNMTEYLFPNQKEFEGG